MHMNYKALRYAAMISTMTFDKACDYYAQYPARRRPETDAREAILEFVDLDENSLDDFGNDVRIVLASADFGKELTTSVLWLRDKGIDISCVRLTPYRYKEDYRSTLNRIIPVHEVEEYRVKFREKRAEQRTSVQKGEKDVDLEYRRCGHTYKKRRLALALVYRTGSSATRPQSS
ncbi:hypothetical protein ACT691_02155 [Vibrio metschnikovii]